MMSGPSKRPKGRLRSTSPLEAMPCNRACFSRAENSNLKGQALAPAKPDCRHDPRQEREPFPEMSTSTANPGGPPLAGGPRSGWIASIPMLQKANRIPS